jgi:hypothetical protein
MSEILDHLELPWNWAAISRNQNITIKDVINNHSLPWNWCNISYDKHITIEDVVENITLPWIYPGLCANTFGLPKRFDEFKRCISQTQTYKTELICMCIKKYLEWLCADGKN